MDREERNEKNEKEDSLRLGIIGSGRIAGRFVREARLFDAICLMGAYNPHEESARHFIQEHALPRAYSDVDAFLSDCDAIYIATPHATHHAYARAALEQGKHILCEKPMCLRKADAEELFALAEKNGLILMEGYKTAYAPGFRQLLDLIHQGTIGEVRDIEACFTRLTPDGVRELTDIQAGGSFTEFGSYTLLPMLKLFGSGYTSMRADMLLDANGLDVYAKVAFRYPQGMALSKTGLKVKSDGQLILAGTKGYIRVTPPWWKTSSFTICYEDYTKNRTIETEFLGYGLRYEIQAFLDAVRGKNAASVEENREISIAMAGIMESFLHQRLILMKETSGS